MIPLDQLASLALFARVVEHRSFSAAAREAGLAKSAVSKRIAALEERLGVTLLRRSTRKLSLTDEGMAVYEHSAALVASATAAGEVTTATRKAARGRLKVNAPVTLAQMHLAGAVAGFLQTHPGIEVDLWADDRMVDVIDGGFDVVVRVGRLQDSGLRARKLATDRLVVCAAPEYLARAGTLESPDDLLGHECMHYGLVSRAGEWRFRGENGAVTVPTRGRFTSSDGTVLRNAALAGAGLAVLPYFMVAPDVAAGRLALVLEGFRRAEIGVFALHAHRTDAPARVQLFVTALAAYFGRARWQDGPGSRLKSGIPK